MAIQNVVEKWSFRLRKEKNVVAKTVEEAWEQSEEVKLTTFSEQWCLVLDLIIEDEDGDRLVFRIYQRRTFYSLAQDRLTSVIAIE